MRAKFSEREFEFCFNCEFIRKNANVIIGVPSIPSLRLEALFGYDVEFRLKQGNIQYSLFLQYKVPFFVSKPWGRNWRIYRFYGGPYYYFNLERTKKYSQYSLMSLQHNLLYYLRRSGEEVYYSAPLFHEWSVFNQCFINKTIIDNSIFIDPYSIGPINDFDLHKISYNQNGTQAVFHSEIKEKIRVYNFKALIEKMERRKIDKEYFSKLLSILQEGIAEVFPEEKIRLPEEMPCISKCIHLLRRYYKLQWLMF